MSLRDQKGAVKNVTNTPSPRAKPKGKDEEKNLDTSLLHTSNHSHTLSLSLENPHPTSGKGFSHATSIAEKNVVTITPETGTKFFRRQHRTGKGVLHPTHSFSSQASFNSSSGSTVTSRFSESATTTGTNGATSSNTDACHPNDVNIHTQNALIEQVSSTSQLESKGRLSANAPSIRNDSVTDPPMSRNWKLIESTIQAHEHPHKKRLHKHNKYIKDNVDLLRAHILVSISQKRGPGSAARSLNEGGLDFVLRNRGFDAPVTLNRKKSKSFVVVLLVCSVLILIATAVLVMSVAYTTASFPSKHKGTTLSKEPYFSPYQRICNETHVSQSPGQTARQSTAVLEVTNKSGSIENSCIGVLLDRHNILTTASCVAGSRPEGDRDSDFVTNVKVVVYLGIGDADAPKKMLNHSAQITANQTHSSEFVYIHSSYATFRHEQVDLAVVRVRKPVVFNTQVGPACMAEFGDTSFSKCHRLLGLGYSLDEDLNMYTSSQCLHFFYSHLFCKRASLGNSSAVTPLLYQYAMRAGICANNDDSTVDVDNANSPLFCYTGQLQGETQTHKLVGLALSITREAECNQSSVLYFVSVAEARDWIEFVAVPVMNKSLTFPVIEMVEKQLTCLKTITALQYKGSKLLDDVALSIAKSLSNPAMMESFVCRTFLQWEICKERHSRPDSCDRNVVLKNLQDINITDLFLELKCAPVGCTASQAKITISEIVLSLTVIIILLLLC